MKEDDELDELDERSEDLPEEEEEVDQTVDEDAADPAQGKFDRLVAEGENKYKLSGMYRDWFLDYASYVILDRAVPHIEDGLKPVQRRILHAMQKVEDGHYHKVAGIVGDTMKYHPHGDASIKDALVGLGHGCGHNLFGPTSLLAASALKQVIDEVGGEVRVYGTPGEEGGENGSAKGSFVREGFLRDVDAALCVHPGDRHEASSKNIACLPVDIEFWGKSAHAAAAPEQGINALDALILTYNGINALRQHVTPDVRIHGIVTSGGHDVGREGTDAALSEPHRQYGANRFL